MTDHTQELLLASRRCAQCLTTRNRIVDGERAAAIVRDCRSERRHFRCHKGDEAGRYRVVEDVCLLLEEASEQADPALATEIRDFVGFLRDKQVGRMTPNGPIAGTWSNDPIRFMTEVNILVRRFADRLSPPVQDHKPIAS